MSLNITPCGLSISQMSPLQEKKFLSYEVQNQDGKIFLVVPVTSEEDLKTKPKEIHLDLRISTSNTPERLSCLKGLALDPEFIRSQIYLIKDQETTIGIATLFCAPYKHLDKLIYLERQGNRLVSKTFMELYNPKTHSFVIESGWFQLLPEYRKQKLGADILAKVLIPQIKDLAKQDLSATIIPICSAAGTANKIRAQFLHGTFPGLSQEIEISEEIKPLLGRTSEEAQFTSNAAEKLLMTRSQTIFNYTLGPVYISERCVLEQNHPEEKKANF